MANFRKRGKKWEYRITYTKDGEKITESKGGFYSKREAEFAAIEHQDKINKGIFFKLNNSSFSEYMKQWATLYKKNHVSRITYATIERICRVAETLFNDKKISDINKTVYQNAINHLNHLSPASI